MENSAPKIPSVTDLINAINEQLSFLTPAEVVGEISQFVVRPPKNHWYFTIKDEQSHLECSMWSSYTFRTGFTPALGDKVVLKGRLDVYGPNGRLKFVATEMKRYGEGELYEKFIALSKRLKAEGLFDEAIKKRIPRVPQKIAIITSEAAAAYQDVINRLNERADYAFRRLYSVQVQGEAAASQIVAAIRKASEDDWADVVLLVRGGGSIQDLWCFNDERIAYAIRDSKIPIITGIGHETDLTIADLAADLRAPTPTAAAEAAAEKKSVLLNDVRVAMNNLQRHLEHAMDSNSHKIVMASVSLDRPKALVQEKSNSFNTSTLALQREKQVYNDLMHERYQRVSAGLRLLKPEKQNTRFDLTRKMLSNAAQFYMKNLQSKLSTELPNMKESFSFAEHRLKTSNESLYNSANKVISEDRNNFLRALNLIKAIRPRPKKENFFFLATTIEKQVALRANVGEQKVKLLSQTLELLDPKKSLIKGAAFVFKEGKLLSTTRGLKEGDEVEITLQKGKFIARVGSVLD